RDRGPCRGGGDELQERPPEELRAEPARGLAGLVRGVGGSAFGHDDLRSRLTARPAIRSKYFELFRKHPNRNASSRTEQPHMMVEIVSIRSFAGLNPGYPPCPGVRDRENFARIRAARHPPACSSLRKSWSSSSSIG